MSSYALFFSVSVQKSVKIKRNIGKIQSIQYMYDVEDDEIDQFDENYDNDYSYESDTYIEDEDNTLSKRMKLLSNLTSKDKEIISNNEPFAKNKIGIFVMDEQNLSIFLSKLLDQLVMHKEI